MASTSTTSTSTKEQQLYLYVMPGSQFSAKVIAALDARSIPHYCVFVPMKLEKRQTVIPSGGTFVPELKAITTDGETHIVPDSEAILHWMDDHLQTNLFPSSDSSELSLRASTKVLAGAVWYFNWVDPEGYNRSMKKAVTKAQLPAFVPSLLGEPLVDLFLSSTKAKFKQLAMEAMNVDEDALKDSMLIRDKLVEELKYFQSYLKTEDQLYLLGDNSKNEPTAPDFSVYVQVERLVGTMGDANVLPSLPELLQTTPELDRFWKWRQNMTEKHPLVFKGKRPPAE